ncbi:MAG: DUF4474 domain-containing protein [Clostridia bacterium]|nr:DUF4474 domain-containing protein [Clostridia bacterium]MBO7319376.1 DUF4474 domain-containing protein [Clostridia bacterium]
MKKLCRFGLLLLITLIAVSFSVISASAAEVKKTSVDTVGAVMAKNAYEVVVKGEGINLVKGKKMQLTAEVTNVKKQPAITWTSSDTSVATIDENGIVKGEGVGRALITATAKVAGQTIEGYYSINVITSKNFIKNFMEGNQIVSYQYSYVDDYFYTNDKDCWQDTFGYARLYDLAAPYVVLEYDYTRVFFTYEDRDFMVQLWKGQYGYVFYGAEIGIYTKDISDKEPGYLTFYGKAEEEYWPTMEMTIYHENIDGEWEREFTRDYDKYWWCTGFKLGHLRDVEPADELRMVSKITFKDAKMAKQFALGLKACGLKRAKNVNSLENDTYYRVKDTVHVRWQNISEAENTMPVKLGAATLFFFNFLALLLAGFFMLGMGAFGIGLLFFI